MTPRQRVIAALNREPVDRPPVISPVSVATTESMEITDAYFPGAHYDAEKMARLAAAGHELLNFDCVMPYFSIMAEAEALGAVIKPGAIDIMPSAASRPFTDPGDFQMPDDFLSRPTVNTIVESIKILKKRFGDEVAICGKVIGPWTLSYNLYGTDLFLMDLIDEPERARAFLNAFMVVPLTFAKAQIEAGADMITWADHATGDMISAKMYEEFLYPVHRECMKEFREKVSIDAPVILHTCGKTIDRMGLFAQTGFTAFHFDSKNDPAETFNLVGDKIILAGCISNTEVLQFGTPEDVKKQTRAVMAAGIPVIAPECAVPCGVKNENLRAIVTAVEEEYL